VAPAKEDESELNIVFCVLVLTPLPPKYVAASALELKGNWQTNGPWLTFVAGTVTPLLVVEYVMLVHVTCPESNGADANAAQNSKILVLTVLLRRNPRG
jgi:hypothetical protein